MAQYRYDATTGTYLTANGAELPAAVVRGAVEQLAQVGRERLRRLGQRLLDGDVALADWQTQSAAELKRLHLLAGTVAHGGWSELSPSDFGYIGSQLKQQYGYLRGFAEQIASGQQPLDGRILTRLGLYGDAVLGTFANMQARDGARRGADEERWVLSAAEHCDGCVSRAARGWAPLGTLPGFATQPCRTRCRCAHQTRRAEAA